jgi:hypothetical protein
MHTYKELRNSTVTLAIQILSIIFSILLALSLNDWKESRNNKQLALMTLKNFREEIGNNKRAIETALRDQRIFLRSLENGAPRIHTGKEKTLALPEINLPDVLTATWETALGTKAMVYIDYDMISKLSELYLQQKWLMSLEDKIFQTILSPYSYEKKNAENLTRALYVSLRNIMEVEGKLLSMYESALQKIDTIMRKQ